MADVVEGLLGHRVPGGLTATDPFALARFHDAELADRAAAVPAHLLEDAIEIAATAASAGEISDWLQSPP